MTKGYLPPLIKSGLTPLEYLASNGYFEGDFPDDSLKEDDPIFQAAAIRYQEFAGLIPDGHFGPISASRANEKRCGLPDLDRGFVKVRGKWKEFNVADAACPRRWSDSAKNSLSCCQNNMAFSTLSAAEVDRVWWQGLVEWMKVCDVTFKRVPFSNSANFTHDKESIDGSGNVLAYHYLPNCDEPGGSSLQGRYDSGERWNANFFQGVHVHESGHGLGLSHSSSRADIMYPYYNSAYKTPQPGDVRRVVALYGTPSSPLPPGPQPEPPTDPTTIEERLRKCELDNVRQDILIEILLGR